MKVQLFSVYDRKASIYMSPFVARSTIDATRQIAASFREPQMRETPVGQHPEDFDLFHVGSFDDETGDIVSFQKAALVAPILSLVPKAEGPSTVAS